MFIDGLVARRFSFPIDTVLMSADILLLPLPIRTKLPASGLAVYRSAIFNSSFLSFYSPRNCNLGKSTYPHLYTASGIPSSSASPDFQHLHL